MNRMPRYAIDTDAAPVRLSLVVLACTGHRQR
jgi:hypothetical protein